MKEGAEAAADLQQHRRPAVRADEQRKLRWIDCMLVAEADVEKPDFSAEKPIDSTDIVSGSGADAGAQRIRDAVSDDGGSEDGIQMAALD